MVRGGETVESRTCLLSCRVSGRVRSVMRSFTIVATCFAPTPARQDAGLQVRYVLTTDSYLTSSEEVRRTFRQCISTAAAAAAAGER